MKTNTYALYYTKDFECLVTMGCIKDIASYLETSSAVIRSGLCRKVKFKGRYELVKLWEGNDGNTI